MSDSTLDQIKAAWTMGAGDYDYEPGRGLVTPAISWRWQRVLSRLIGHEPRELLDVGTGTGMLAVEAAKAGHRVTGSDVTPAMLERARLRSNDAHVVVEWIEADAMALPFEDDQFDVTMSRQVLWTIEDPELAFREWIRVTRSGGEITWFDSLWPDWAAFNQSLRGRLVSMAQGIKGSKWLKSTARLGSPALSCHYGAGIQAELPFRELTTVRPIRDTLSRLSIEDVSFRYVRRQLGPDTGRHFIPRLRPRERYYVGWFTVSK